MNPEEEKFEEALEAAYWAFDTRNKKGSQSERDNFKWVIREMMSKLGVRK